MKSAVEPLRLVVTFPAAEAPEIVLLLDVLNQLVEQIWNQHGDEITDFLLRQRREGRRLPKEDFPF